MKTSFHGFNPARSVSGGVDFFFLRLYQATTHIFFFIFLQLFYFVS